MAAVKIKWSSLLNLTELEFIPEPLKVLEVSDELVQAISWLTAATGHDRRLLRCTENGALLVADPWSLLSVVETKQMRSYNGVGVDFSTVIPNKGVLIATSVYIVKIGFNFVDDIPTESVYLPPNCLYWYPRPVSSCKAYIVPSHTGIESYVGLTAFN